MATQTFQVRVDARNPWQQTQAVVQSGDQLAVNVPNPGLPNSNHPKPWPWGPNCDPDGHRSDEVNPTTWTDAIAPNIVQFSLIGRIGQNGTPFPVGASFNQPMTENGTLYLSFNDGVNFNDNSGYWDVDIAVTDRPLTLREKTYVLAITGESGAQFTDNDRAVVVHVLENRDNLTVPNSYLSPEMALGTSQVAPTILNGAVGNTQIEKIENQYAYFAGGGNPGIQTAFQAAYAFVRGGIGNDFTGGALQFSHAVTPTEAQAVAQSISNCGQSVIEGIIIGAGVDPIVNGSSMVVASTNITIYINMNYTLPSALSGAPSCP